MTLSDVITQLTRLRDAHGDLLVLHHDDWDNFLVEQIDYVPADESPDETSYQQMAHVLLTGDHRRLNGAQGIEDLNDRR